ncbi:MAG: hypothetical protein JWM80_410 [Cyanobacteria bacterium RYN_339]|nr:hypothetical protein [Cyanobacteria bacterium RYN_339]
MESQPVFVQTNPTQGPVKAALPTLAAAVQPKPAKPPTADQLGVTEAAVMAKLGTVHLAPGRDHLAVTVGTGDTLWKIASRWGAQGSTAAYVRAIKQANGLKGDAIGHGQQLHLPYDAACAGLDLLVALAVKKDMAARGPKAPALDLKGLHVSPGPLDSYLVTAPRKDGKGLQHFAIFDDQTGEDAMKWVVQPIDKAEYDKRARGDV